MRFAENPHFIDDVSQAIVLRTKNISAAAIERRARDIKRKLAEATEQLPTDRPGVIHIGIEALGSDAVERRRYNKITESINNFNTYTKPISFIYWHYFAPEAPPDELWAIDETFMWRGIRDDQMPLLENSLILPPESVGREGAHWDGQVTPTYR